MLVTWTLRNGCPIVEVEFIHDGNVSRRVLLADTGFGSEETFFQIVLTESDCRLFKGAPCGTAPVIGAVEGTYPTYMVKVQVRSLRWQRHIFALAVPSMPNSVSAKDLDGIACFPFLNQFGYGNFDDSQQFGLKTT
jgi:hypothetical protein